jgi:hypothetical protein
MIKIEIENIDSVKKEYFEGVKQLILDRVNFYLIVFRVIDRQHGFNTTQIETYKGLSPTTKNSLIKLVGKTKKSITRKKNYFRLQQPKFLFNLFYIHRTDIINILTRLSDVKSLNELILAEVDNLEPLATSYSYRWFDERSKALIQEIIPYDKFIKKEAKPYNGYNLANALKVNVCPYCNRVYTNTIIGKGNSLIIRPTFDHFFSQKDHPILALSFFNLIPSCNYCNSSLKGSIPFVLDMHLHPYKEGFGTDVTFDYLQIAFNSDKSDPNNFKIILKKNIAINHIKHSKIFGDGFNPQTGSANVFRLQEIYQGHTDVVGELIVKSDKLSPYYAGRIINMLSVLGASKKEFYRFYFANYLDEKDFNKRPLAKLTKDIITKYLPEIID